MVQKYMGAFEDVELEKDDEAQEPTFDISIAPEVEYVPQRASESEHECDWMSVDFVEETKIEPNGLTIDSYQKEVREWQDDIRALKTYDESEIRRYLNTCNLNVPSKGDSYDEVAEAYYRHARMETELVHRLNRVRPHVDYLVHAYNSLKDTAFAVAPGRTVDERKANAAHMASPFLRHYLKAKRLMDFIIDVRKSVEANRYIMQAMAKERETYARIDQNMVAEGGASRFRNMSS